mgnify:FL=1|tara:strand:+ start:1786 stop:2094 length:309 start_codon:yes stop_codon:yes gene_type:complete
MKAQIYNHSIWIEETNPKTLKDKFNKILSESGFSVLEVSEKHFKPYGYTALFLLSESHLAIHTFPEENTTYLELSSCIKKPFYNFIDNIQKWDKEEKENQQK